IIQICSHETQATVDPTFRKLSKSLVSNVPVMEQMTYLMKNHRRAHERCQTDAGFKKNLLNHCIVQLLEDNLGSRAYERTLQLYSKWQLMDTHELLQLLSPDIQEAQIRLTQRLVNRRGHNGDTARGKQRIVDLARTQYSVSNNNGNNVRLQQLTQRRATVVEHKHHQDCDTYRAASIIGRPSLGGQDDRIRTSDARARTPTTTTPKPTDDLNHDDT
ncbi:hypothetical protein SARC_07749, partial [Sphaeroforma arctica JP610]